MNRQVLTILSCNYSGSHFLSLMLGSHSRTAHIGEVRSLRRSYQRPRKPCYLCADPQQCPITRGISPANIQRVYETIFENFNDERLATLIDTSKKTDWAERFVHDRAHDMRYLHLIRDPRALIRRWTMLYQDSLKQRLHERWRGIRQRPGRLLSMTVGPLWRVYLYRWLEENRQISRFIEQHGLNAMLITYREAALQPQQTIERVMRWLGLSFEPAQLEYWRFEHHGSQKPEYEWVKREKKSFFDQRWREFLDPAVQQQVAADVDVQRYLRSQELTLGEHGLERIGDVDAAGAPADSPAATDRVAAQS